MELPMLVHNLDRCRESLYVELPMLGHNVDRCRERACMWNCLCLDTI